MSDEPRSGPCPDVAGVPEDAAPAAPLALAGRSILVTRETGSAGDLVALLEARGARAIVVGVLEFLPPADEEPFHAALGRLSSYSWIAFTSVRAVERVLACLDDPVTDLAGVRVAAVGPRTARAVEACGVRVSLQARHHDARSLIEDLTGLLGPGDRLLYPRAEQVSTELAEPIRATGAIVDEPVVYRVEAPAGGAPEAAALLGAGELDWITAYSGSALRHLRAMLSDPALMRRARLATIGPATSRAARSLGLSVHAEARSPDAASLVAAIVASERANM